MSIAFDRFSEMFNQILSTHHNGVNRLLKHCVMHAVYIKISTNHIDQIPCLVSV